MATGETGGGYLIPRVAGTAALATALVTGAAVGTASGAAGRPMTAHAHVTASATAPGYRMALMRAAAREFRVPGGLLLAISYNQTRWQRQGGSPRIDGGYWLMNPATGSLPAEHGRGDPAQPP